METTNKPAIYFKTLYLRNIKCFKGEYELDFSDKNGKPAQWTVFLGNNNTGKTTILRALALLSKYSVLPKEKFKINNKSFEIKGDICVPSPNLNNLINNKDGHLYVQFNDQISISPFVHKDDWFANLWGIDKEDSIIGNDLIKNLFLLGYGTSRRISEVQLSSNEESDLIKGLFSDKIELLNFEEWFLQVFLASKNETLEKEKRVQALQRLADIKQLLIDSKVLPDVKDLGVISSVNSKQEYKTYVVAKTDFGDIPIRDLGYGYQSTIAWLGDLAKRMFERYPDLENPLHGPAVVLVDEIDLHLHPEWQRKIISFLSGLFPHTQFIVTAHSPLIVQSADNVNLVMLEKDGDSISIRQQFGSFQGWTVDEILRELMDLGDKTRSDKYLSLMKQFDEALLEDNYEKAQDAYEQLDKILSPSSHQRKVLQIQLAPLSSVHA